MAKKFDINAEISLKLGASVDRQITVIKNKLDKVVSKPRVLALDVNVKNIEKKIKNQLTRIPVDVILKIKNTREFKKAVSDITTYNKVNLLVNNFKDFQNRVALLRVRVPANLIFDRNAARNSALAINNIQVNGRIIVDRVRLRNDLLNVHGLRVFAHVIPIFQTLQNRLSRFTQTVRVNVVPNTGGISGGGGGSGNSNTNAGSSGGGSINTSGLNRASAALSGIRTQTEETISEMEALGRQTGNTIRRFGVFNVAYSSFNNLISAIQSGFREAINFEKELVKISQVTGSSKEGLSGLTSEITKLAVGLGVSSNKLLDTSQVLAQAGLTADDVKISLDALAKSELAPTFTNIADTGEASIAAMAQFKYEAKDLGEVLSSLNAVSAKFAVESSDLTTVIKRTGGAFAAAGGNVNELNALFTSVRATTRESAETIATGFRTIFTRLQRARTQKFLKDLGVDLQDLEGNFVGPYKAVQRLSAALGKISSQDPRYSQVVEELGGFRQISKVIPLIQQFSLAQQAYIVATSKQDSLTDDAIEGQKSLANQLAKVREEFLALIRDIQGDDSFKQLADFALGFAKALIDVTRNLKEAIGPLAILGAIALKAPATDFLRGIGASFDRGGPRSSNNTGRPGSSSLSGPSIGPVGAAALGISALELFKFNDSVKQATNNLVAMGAQFGALKFLLTELNSQQRITQRNSLAEQQAALTTQINAARPVNNQLRQNFTNADANFNTESRSLLLLQARQRQNSLYGINDLQLNQNITDSQNRVNNLMGIRNNALRQYTDSSVELSNNTQILRTRQVELDTLNRTINQFNILNNAIAGVSSVALSLSSYLNQVAQEEKAKLQLNNGTGNANSFIASSTAGGALSGAVTGGISASVLIPLVSSVVTRLGGAAIGTAIGGPVGTAVGFGLGAAGGAALSGSASFDKASKDVNLIKFQSEQNKNAGIFKALADPTRNDFFSNALRAQSITRDYNSQLGKASGDPVLQKEIKAALDFNVVGLNQLVDSVSNSVSSLKEFNAVISQDTLVTLSEISNIPLSELSSRIKDNIAISSKKNQIDIKSITAAKNFEERIRALTIFGAAFNNATQVVEKFTSDIEASLSSGVGNTEIKSSLPVGGLANIFNIPEFEKQVSSFSSQFGQAGQVLGTTVIDAGKALKALPDILYDLRSTAPFDAEGSFSKVFEEQLDQAKIGGVIKQTLVAKLNDLLGAEVKDSSVYEKLNKELAQTIQDFSSGFDSFFQAITTAETETNKALNGFASGLGKLRESFNSLTTLFDQRDTIRGQQLDFNRSVNSSFGRSTGFGAELALERSTLARKGTSNISGTVAQIAQSQKDLSDGEGLLKQTQDVGLRKQIILALDKERFAIQKNVKALEFMANATNRTSQTMNALNAEQSKRASKFNLLKQFAGANTQERFDLQRNLGLSRVVAKNGFNAISDVDRGNVMSFIEGLGEAAKDIIGASLSEILLKQSGAIKGVTVANDKEKTLTESMNEAFKQAQEANNALIKIQTDNQKTFFVDLNKTFDKFLTTVAATLFNAFSQGTKTQIGAKTNELATLQNDSARLNNIQQAFGVDPKVIKAILPGLKSAISSEQSLVANEGALNSIISRLDSGKIQKLGSSGSEQAVLDYIKDITAGLDEVTKLKINRDILPQIGIKQERLGKDETRFVVNDEALRTFIKSQTDVIKKSRLDNKDTEAKLADQVGGVDKLSKIRQFIPKLEADFKNISSTENNTAQMAKLTQEIQALERSLHNQQINIPRFATGGMVGGVGNSDSVPAKLMPGEFVMRKSAVQKYGVDFMSSLNKGYASGGPVASSVNISNLDNLSSFISAFSNQIDKFGQYINSIPSTIQMNGNHRVEVIINGAQVLQNIQPEIQKMIQVEIARGINKMLNNKFPEVGPYNG